MAWALVYRAVVLQLSLRSRLTLAFLALAALVAVVGVTTAVIHNGIRRQVAELHPEGGVDLMRVDLTRSGVEIQGAFTDGMFVARDVELLPAVSDPKLRGAISAIDPDKETITLFGQTIHVDEDARVLGRPDGADGVELDLTTLRPGQRVEVECEIDDGVWNAEEIRVDGVKASDKIKAMATGVVRGADGSAKALDVYGLTVDVDGIADGTGRGAMNHVRTATHLLIGALEFKNAARGVGAQDVEVAERAVERLHAIAEGFNDDLDRALEESREGSESSGAIAWLDPIVKVRAKLAAHIEAISAYAVGPERSHLQAARYLDEEFAPFLEMQLEPRILAYLSQSRDDLGDRLEDVVARTDATGLAMLATAVVALVSALVLGFLVWRSIHRPIAGLHAAARRLGQGDLSTRVDPGEREDELGDLAIAFNRMAEDLETSTVSIDNLERVLSEKELLLREVHHRVKSNMQVISSLLAMQALHSDDPHLIAGFEESQARIRSMALIHEQLYQSDDLARIDVRVYLDVLIGHLQRSYGGADIVATLDAVEVPLGLDASLACGLIVNELVVNAFKHAFQPGRAGTIRVTLKRNADGEAELTVADNGSGLAEGETDGSTLGMSLVGTLAQQLGGRHVVEASDGVSVRVTFPTAASSMEVAS